MTRDTYTVSIRFANGSFSRSPHGSYHGRDALLRNPTLEAATLWWRGAFPRDTLLSPLSPLAAVHKARLQWLDATDAMIEESLAWLKEHDFAPALSGTPPMTPESRDADRAIIGKPPLKGLP